MLYLCHAHIGLIWIGAWIQWILVQRWVPNILMSSLMFSPVVARNWVSTRTRTTNMYIMYMYIRIFMYPCHFGKKIRIYNYNTRKSEVQGNFPTRLVANWEAHTIYNLMLTVQLWLVPGIFTICVWPFKLLVVFRHPSSKYQGGSKTKDVSHFLAFQLCVPSHIWWNPQSVVSKLGKLPPLVHS